MGLLESIMQDDARFGFSETFGESDSVTWTPNGGNAIPITAIIDRDAPLRKDEATGKLYKSRFEIDVENSATTGVSSAASNIEAGYFTIPKRSGHAEMIKLTVMSLNQIVSQDAGRLRFSFK